MFHLEDDQFLLSTSWERCFFRTKNTSIFGSWIPILNHKSRVFQYATTSVMSSLKSHVTDFIRWWCVVCYVLWKYPYINSVQSEIEQEQPQPSEIATAPEISSLWIPTILPRSQWRDGWKVSGRRQSGSAPRNRLSQLDVSAQPWFWCKRQPTTVSVPSSTCRKSSSVFLTLVLLNHPTKVWIALIC